MIEFMKEYWQFFAAGLILIALISYWIFDVVRTKKAKAKQFDEMEAKLEEEPQEEPAEEPVEKEELAKEEQEEKAQEEEPQEEPAEKEEDVEPSAEKQEEKKLGVYMVSYDKEKKDWVVKRRGSKRATKRTKTKKEALEVVKSLTENQDTSFVVKKKDGKFQKK